MSDPYIGEIRMFGGNFAPVDWALCQGQLMAISQNAALFALLGTTYGGDGVQTFNLPDLRGRAPMHQGQGPGITAKIMGERAGLENVTLTTNQLPGHSHPMVASTDPADQINGSNGVVAAAPTLSMYIAAPPDSALNSSSVQSVGGNQPHENMQPFLVVTFIIALAGIFPTRS